MGCEAGLRLPGRRHQRHARRVRPRRLPDFEYAEYAALCGLKGIYCDEPGNVTAAWQEALASDRPVVVEFVVDNEIAPIPPHIMKDQAKKAAKAGLRDPQKVGIAARGLRQKLTDIYENMPGRRHDG